MEECDRNNLFLKKENGSISKMLKTFSPSFEALSQSSPLEANPRINFVDSTSRKRWRIKDGIQIGRKFSTNCKSRVSNAMFNYEGRV